MSIEVLNESGEVPPPVTEQELHDLGRYVLDQMRVHPRTELAITLVDESAMEALHVQWMDLPGPTDVMSFPMDELRPGSDTETTDGVLGDVVLCPVVARRQAKEAGHSVADEILLLTTHGILHLLGFDHAEPDEEREMFELQRTLLLTYLAQRGRTTTAAPGARAEQ
ncbi:rRNA maturation RNase YbeY [Ornithinimicrobium murale]|uniref:rRNA maturation RNase YbeY n=1 Tax=Ornithinimicrobium murale TaxID=1050153 RepID=UPI000E0D20C9|nr:rRNA maturation RNase YbeY [Ornithinimicrobium murale]